MISGLTTNHSRYSILDQAILISVAENNYRGVVSAIHNRFYSSHYEQWCYQAILQSAALGHVEILAYLLQYDFIKQHAHTHNNHALNLAIEKEQYHTSYLLMTVDAVRNFENTYQCIQKRHPKKWAALQNFCINQHEFIDLQNEPVFEGFIILEPTPSPITTAYNNQQKETQEVSQTYDEHPNPPENKSSSWCVIS